MDPNSTALSLQAVKDYPRRFAIMGAHDLLFQPMALDRMDTHHLMSPGHMPNLKRMPRDIIAAGRYFHGFDTWECSIEFCGEDMWLFASDWPHGDTGWAEGVQQTADWLRLSDSTRRKILGENATRLCPRLRS
jgi:predicted TIM-barrel fold metal-dependent hydrolase